MEATVEDMKRDKVIARLRRVEGQLRGIQRMILSGQECEAVAQQLTASRHALDRVFFEMVACSMERELDERGGDPEQCKQAVAVVSRILAKYG